MHPVPAFCLADRLFAVAQLSEGSVYRHGPMVPDGSLADTFWREWRAVQQPGEHFTKVL